MTEITRTHNAAEPSIDPERAVKLRGDPPRVMRLSRKAIGIAAACASALMGGTLIFALKPESLAPTEELYNTDGNAVADRFVNGPKSYDKVPQLGAPLPGDLGRPILDAQRRGDIAELPPIGAQPSALQPTAVVGAAETVRQRRDQEREAARGSRLFFSGASSNSENTSAAMQDALDRSAAPMPDPSQSVAATRQAFPGRAPERPIASDKRLTGALSPFVLQAGSVIPAALITGIRSDLPGLVTAQVTQNVYDTLTGRVLLVPQGARLIGGYASDVAFGQSRVQLVWSRLILPDGRSIVLDRVPAADTQGFAGLQDGTDYHWGGVLKAALISTLLGVGSELGTSTDGNLARAIRRGAQDSVNQAGEQIVSRELGVRPTLTIRPGHRVLVLVTQDIVLGDSK